VEERANASRSISPVPLVEAEEAGAEGSKTSAVDVEPADNAMAVDSPVSEGEVIETQNPQS
jgi:hypothetical protein